jgi:hypothetical protein
MLRRSPIGTHRVGRLVERNDGLRSSRKHRQRCLRGAPPQSGSGGAEPKIDPAAARAGPLPTSKIATATNARLARRVNHRWTQNCMAGNLSGSAARPLCDVKKSGILHELYRDSPACASALPTAHLHLTRTRSSHHLQRQHLKRPQRKHMLRPSR